MARLVSTIWALILNNLGVSIFHTCFADALEDELGLPRIQSPTFTTFLITASVYIIIVNSTMFPKSFRKPKILMCLYEFLVTAFFLEFAIACVWVPINVLVLNTLPENIYHILILFQLKGAAEIVYTYKSHAILLVKGMATLILLETLNVTRAIDLRDKNDGIIYFPWHLGKKLYQRVRCELS